MVVVCYLALRMELKSVLNVYQSKWGHNSSLLPKPSIIGDKVAKHFSNASKNHWKKLHLTLLAFEEEILIYWQPFSLGSRRNCCELKSETRPATEILSCYIQEIFLAWSTNVWFNHFWFSQHLASYWALKVTHLKMTLLIQSKNVILQQNWDLFATEINKKMRNV